MVKIVLVEKNGSLKESKLKDENEEMFYKNCGYRNSNYFDLEASGKQLEGMYLYTVKRMEEREVKINMNCLHR